MKYVRLKPSTRSRPNMGTYYMSGGNHGFKFVQGLTYEVSDEIADYLRDMRVDRDKSAPCHFDIFATRDEAEGVMAEEAGLAAPQIGDARIVERAEPKPLDLSPGAIATIDPPRAPAAKPGRPGRR